ncbi:MAG: sugar ABC transporter permease [Chloroflexota bacterium]|nr:MAG: sugar ABC transporter permease [Chloroflexota bacterium]
MKVAEPSSEAQVKQAAAPLARDARRKKRLTRDQWISIALVSPSLLAIAIFVYGFIGWSLLASVSRWDGIVPDFTFVGLRNYLRLFGDARFQIDLRNTVFFTVAFLVSCLVIGLFLAIVLDQRIKGENIFRSVFLFPMALSFIVTGVVWRWLLNPGNEASGAVGINLLIHKLGMPWFRFGWFTDPTIWPGIPFGDIELFIPLGMIAIVLAAFWQMSGYTMALYLAALRGIPEELREAARVDGATEVQIYRFIILPILQPITLSAVIILGHISLKIFDLVYAMTPGGGPAFVTDVPGLYMFKTVFQGNHYALGAAISIIMLLLVAVLIVPYLIYSFRTEVQA